jgi:hypothetical protein
MAAASPRPKTFLLRLVPRPGVDAIKALRWVLKRLLRQHGLKCIGIEELADETRERSS